MKKNCKDLYVKTKQIIIEMVYKHILFLDEKMYCPSSIRDNNDEPILIGINNKKVNSFPFFIFSFDIELPKIVIPLLEIPGNILMH